MTDRPMHAVPGAFQKLQGLYAEGEQAVQTGDLELAVQKFSEGIAIDDHFRQRYVTMYAQRAFALQKLGRLEEAIADYTKAIELGEPPENQAQYHFHRAMCWAGLRAEGDERKANLERAVADHARSIELYPDHPGPYHLRAKLLVDELGRYGEALPDLERALSMRQIPDLYSLRGLALFHVDRAQDALADFERFKAMTGDAYADYMLSACHAKLGRAEHVFSHMAETLAKDPSYLEYFSNEEAFAPYRSDPRFASVTAAASQRRG